MNERIDPETGEVIETPPIQGGGGAAEIVSRGDQLLMIRTKNQLMTAIQRPRDLKKFETQLLSMAAEAGEDFYYSIPYKDHVPGCQNRRNCSCPSKPVEGPGVGLARAGLSLYRNCAVETRPVAELETADAFQVESTFIDFENNVTRAETKRISKLKVLKGGRTVVASGKDLDVVYQIGASKVERDVIVRSLPKHIVDRAWELAKMAALQEKAPIKQQIARVLRRLAEYGVTLAQIERYLGCPFTEEGMAKAEKDAREVLAHLRGILTGIAGGETTADEVFGQPSTENASAPASQQPGSMSAEDLSGRKAAESPQTPGPSEAEPVGAASASGASAKPTNSPTQRSGKRPVTI